MARLAPIWLLPRRGKRLPLSHELERWRYRWALVKATRPGKHHPKEERTCVVTVADDAFTEYLVVLLSSIQKYNPWFRERLLVLHSQTLSPLSEESKDRILKVYPSAEFRLVDEAPFEKYHKDAPQRLWPALLKLHIFRLAEFDRVIFIDSDILCLGDIHYLWEIPADFAACAAGKDKAAKEREADTIKRGLGLNSGVMVIGKKYLSEKIFQKMLTYKSGPCADQDVLTRFFRFKKVYRLDHRYNYHAQFFWKGENTDDVRLLHYAGEKPLQKPELERMKVWFEHHLPIHA
jgi:lipopolysaccharide biosynthesis glycosyltransferase